MEFRSGFSRQTLIRTLIGIACWSGFNVLVLLLVQYLDHRFILSETAQLFVLVPVGLIETAVLVSGFYRLKRFYWNTALICAASIANFAFYLAILTSLYGQSGETL